MKAAPKYVAVIGDLVASRAMEPDERARVQKTFEQALARVNLDHEEDIAATFLVTAGDETQGLLKRVDRCYDVLREIEVAISPARIVFGVGYGGLTTEVKEVAIGMDGPAFHFAREALEKAKMERKAYGKSIQREVRFRSENDGADKLINALFLSLSVMKSHWTAKQAEILCLLERGGTQSEISDSQNIPISNISRAIDAAHFREYQSVVASLREYLASGLSVLPNK